MDRIIEVLVNGSYLTKDNAVGGVQGEANSTYLRIEFDESWDGLAKTIHWWNAKGEDATGVVLTVDQIENILESERVYLTPVPNEATTVSGKCMFAVDGYINGKRQRSAYGQLIVQPGPSGTDVKIEVPTPTQIEQLQTQIEVLLDSIAGASGYAKAAAESATASQSWAAGGTGTREGEDTDNARYWAQLARDLFDPGEGEAGVAITLANHISNETIHITDEEREKWNRKADQKGIDDAVESLAEDIAAIRVEFGAEDWAALLDGEGVALVIPQSDHKRRNGDFGCTLWDGGRMGTWNTLGTDVRWDDETGDVSLLAEEAFAGAIVFYGV